MIDWEPYGPIYSVAPGIKKIKDLPIIEYDEHEERYLSLKQKCKENIFIDDYFTKEISGTEYNFFYGDVSLSVRGDFNFASIQSLSGDIIQPDYLTYSERCIPPNSEYEGNFKGLKILEGSCYSIYMEEKPEMQIYEKKFLDDTPNTDLTEEEKGYFREVVKRACVNEEWDELLKPPSVDEQVEDFIKEFFEDTESEELEQKDYLEEFFKELEEDSDT